MWKCSHCEAINKDGEVCKACGSPKIDRMSSEGTYGRRGGAGGSLLTNAIKNCAGSNVSIAAVIFFAAYILLQIISVLVTVNSAAGMLKSADAFGISGLSEAIVSSIINYSMSAIIVFNLPAIVICVFGMIYCFYARTSKSELKITAVKAIKIVEIIEIVLYGLSILIGLIAFILFIPNVPDAAQGGLILIALSILGYQTLGLIFKIFLVITLTSLIKTISNDKPVGKISIFVGVMLYVYGAIMGTASLMCLIYAPELTLSLGCRCTAYILFAVAMFKLKHELEKVSNKKRVAPMDYTYGYEHKKSVDVWKHSEDLDPSRFSSVESELKGHMGPRYKTSSSSAARRTPARSIGGFKRTDDLD